MNCLKLLIRFTKGFMWQTGWFAGRYGAVASRVAVQGRPDVEVNLLTSPRIRRMSRFWLGVAVLVGLCAIETAAAQTPGPKTPKLLSVFPAGIKIGTSHEAEVLGIALGAVRSAWFE